MRLRVPSIAGGPPVLAALIAWNAGNFAFFLVAGHMLGPEDYGLAVALLAVTVVLSVPCNALAYGVARVVAAPPGGNPERATALYHRAWWRATWLAPALGAVAGAVIVAVWVAHRDVPVGPLLLTVVAVLPMGALFLSLGALQGDHRYRGYAVAFSLMGVPRPIVFVPLAALGLGVYAAVGASVVSLGSAAAVGAGLTAARLVRAPAPEPGDWSTFLRSLVPMAAGLSGIAVLTNVDVIAAKLALPDRAAGEFAAVSVLAKAVILVPQAVAIVLLPRIAARAARGEATGRLLAVAVSLTLVVGGLVSLVLIPLAEPIVRLAFGSKYVGGAPLLAGFAAASTLLGALIVLVNHHVGRGDYGFVWAVGGLALVDVALLGAFHGSGAQIVGVDAVVGALGLVIHEVMHGRSADGVVRNLAGLVRDAQVPGRRRIVG